MKLCIPTDSEAGLQAHAFSHFGSAPWFTLVDTESEEVEVLPNRNAHHAHGTCQPLSQLGSKRFDAIVVTGIGQRAWASLKAQGTDVFLVDGATVEEIRAAARDGVLQPIESRALCHGHGRGHGSGRGHRHGRGHAMRS